jgi:glutaryl-CoA dehydrogenase
MEKINDELLSKKEVYQDIKTYIKNDLAMLGNLPELFSFLKDMSNSELVLLFDQAKKIKKRKSHIFPEINGDFYNTKSLLTPDEIQILANVREFMKREVEPIATEYWMKGDFPFQIIEGLRKLNICGITLDQKYGGQQRSLLLEGMIGEEIARTDVSVCTFYGVQAGLAMNAINICGSEEQKTEFLPSMCNLSKIGAFGLTEPDVGSGVSMGLLTVKKNGLATPLLLIS